MTFNYKQIAFLFIISTSMCLSLSAIAQKPIEPLIELLNASLVKARSEGAMISIVTADSILYTGGIGYAHRANNEKATDEHLFRMGSISKSFAAIGLMKMVKEGKVILQTPILDIDPNIPINNPWGATHPVTVEHILEHTAGFDDLHHYAWMNVKDETTPPTAQMIQDVKGSLTVRWQPGTKFSYSNPGYIVAGHLIETISGIPYFEYLQKEVLRPIGMSSSGFYFKPPPADLLMSQGYHNEGGQFSPVEFKSVYAGAAGDICSNAKDMAQYLQFIINKGDSTRTIINHEAFDRIEVPKTTLGSKQGLIGGYGLGNGNSWRNGYEFHGHNGGIPGFSSIYVYSREADIGVAVVVNTANGFPNRLLKIILDYFIPYDSATTPKRASQPISEAFIDQYSGYYKYINSRNQLFGFAEQMFDGVSLNITEDHIQVKDLFGSIVDTIYHGGDNQFFTGKEGVNFATIFTHDNNEVLWLGSDYAQRTNLFNQWTVNILFILSIISTIIFFIYGVIRGLIAVCSKDKKTTEVFSWTWLTSISFVMMFVTYILSSGVTDKSEPSVWSIGFLMVSVGFVIFSILSMVKLIMTRRLNFNYYYAISILLMIGLSIYLWANDIVGLRLWDY